MADQAVLGMREHIIEVAAGLFVARGYDGISMREIGEACGISKAGLYYHFADKEALFLAILENHLTELGGIFDHLETIPGGVRARITGFVRAIFMQLPAERRAIIRLASQEMGKVRPQVRDAFGERYQAEFLGRLENILRAGVQAGEIRPLDPALAVWALLGLMYPFFNSSEPEFSPMQAEDLTNFLVDFFFQGAEARGG